MDWKRALAILSLMLSTQFQSPRRWGGVGLTAHAEGHGANLGQRVSIPSEVGRGRADPSGKPCSTPSCLVSIPSEVGRGRARLTRTESATTAWDRVSIPSEVGRGRARVHPRMVRWMKSFQSPRRWGGVGLAMPMLKPSRVRHCFNPLGGGAGSGSRRDRSLPPLDDPTFQSPRRWGGVGLQALSTQAANLDFRFNPLGGGAGSGSCPLRL